MLAPHLRMQREFIRDGIRVRGLSDGAARRMPAIFVHFHEILRARPDLQNKFLLRCARILKGVESARLTSESFASEDLDLTHVKRRTMPCWVFLLSSGRWSRAKSTCIKLG